MSNHDHGPPFWPSMNTISGNHDVTPYRTPPDSRYALSGKIMLAAIFVLFVVVVFMLFLHIYARWYLFRSRRRSHRRRRTHLVFYVDPTNSLPLSSSGLDPSVLKSLPTFTFSSKPAGAGDDESIVPECAVCLSEFEDGETGRRLPKCDHSFHVDCIDMWFHSHSTCPLCRTAVDGDLPAGVEDNEVELTESRQNESTQRETRSSSELNADCPPGPSTSSSFGGRSKAMDIVGVSVEVPARSASFSFGNSDDLGASSPAGQGLKSPTSRLLSLKRILSWEKRPSSPASAIGTSGSELAEMEEGRVETRPHTPR